MSDAVEDALRSATVFRGLTPEDRQRLAAVAQLQSYRRGDVLFTEGETPRHICVVVSGRVKVSKMTRAGKDVILEIFGEGDPIGAVAAYEAHQYPASAYALEDTTTLQVPRQDFFSLLEQHPSMVRGVLTGLTHRIVELTNRITDLTGGRVEPRFARLFLKLAREQGRAERGGTFVPVALSRQELADMTGTTIETCIRIMSRWGKQSIVRTEKDGFVVVDEDALDALALT
ncbi:MAG: Crp/Fnr family transcriptional regulator [Acidobacteriota bacterium]